MLGGTNEQRLENKTGVWLSLVLPICFVENDQLVLARGQCDFFLRETFDSVADHVDA